MPQVSGLERKLRSIRETFKQGSLDTQDTAINELHNALEDSADSLFPSLFYPSCINVLSYYCQALLPHLNMSVEDRQCIQHAFERTIDRLHTQEQHVKNLEAQINRFLLQVRDRQFNSAADLVTAFVSVIRAAQNFRHAHVPPYDGSEDETFPARELEKQYQALKKSPFTAKHVRPFFETLIHNAFSHHRRKQFEWMQSLFWNGLNDLLQMKAVLVNTLTQEALITRLDVETRLELSGLDELDFENRVDERMYLSCWNAIQAARDFLEQHFPDILKKCSIHVICRFPNPAAEYNDASASLLVGLKVIGDVLDMQIDPQVVVSGEVDEAGRILPVSYVAAKLKAAEQHPAIQQLYLPQNGTYLVSKQIALVTVQTFSEAIHGYYGEQLSQNFRLLIDRRQIIKGLVAVLTLPLGLFTFRNIFTHPVTEQDLWNVEYAKELYQKHGDFHKAQDILRFILKKFDSNQTSAETLQIQAQALRHLGVICKQQHKLHHGIVQLQKALSILKSLHDEESQIQILIEIADAYYHAVAEGGIDRNSRMTLRYLNWANEMITPAMPTHQQLKCDYYGALGSLFNELNEYERAKIFMEKSLECYDNDDTSWSYHLSKQCLGRVLIPLEKYEEAFDILNSSLQIPVLQRPYNQARAFRGLSDLFLSIGDEQEGLQFAEKAVKLCKECGLKTQQIALQKMLKRHSAFSMMTDFS